jgi:putative nucleotidyltransferase with HDIG domain
MDLQRALDPTRNKPERTEHRSLMFVHILTDDRNKLSLLSPLLGPQYRITVAMLDNETSVPKECDAVIAAVDVRNANNIAALKEASATFKSARRKIFVLDQKARLFAAQAYALGATDVLFNPVYRQKLLTALHGSAKAIPGSANAGREPREAALEGAGSLASMFSAVSAGQRVDATEAKHAAAGISDAVAEAGFAHWLETVRRHHEGTYQHCLLVTGTATAFGLNLGLAKLDMERLYSAAMFHDVGKAKIPLTVLDKPGRLDDRERALIETHPGVGYDALHGTQGISSEILDAVRHHHEFLDGSGYPDGIGAADISDIVRILTISDIFAALIEDRRYKPPMPREEAYKVLLGMRGKL